MTAQGARQRGMQLWPLALLAVITALGFWFRWRYARDVPLFVDEYLHLRAAERILARGVPLLPSGNFYSHGLLVSYLEAAVLALGGREPWLLRLPVVVISTAAVPLSYWFARRAFRSAGAGLVAAALLALAPEAVLWGGRVRMYGPLQFFALAATAVFTMWVVERTAEAVTTNGIWRVLWVVTFWAALFSHAEAMLLLPVWGVWALMQRGWRWVLRPGNLATFLAAGLAPAIEILLRRLGPPVQARVAPGVLAPQAREYLGGTIDWAGVHKVLEPLLTPSRLPVVLLALGAVAYLALAAWQRRGQQVMPRQRALTYLLAIVIPVLALLLFAVDPEWKSPRYGLMLLPHLFLIAGAMTALVGEGIRRLVTGMRPGLAAGTRSGMLDLAGMTVALLLVVAASWPGAVAATRETVPDYDAAFATVAAQGEPGDAVITFLCPAAFWNLGRCDYLAIPVDFAGFAVEKDGRWVSGWDGVPLLDGGRALRQVLSQVPRGWLVVDEGRLAGRYPVDLVQAVAEEMDLVAAEDEVLVFRSLDMARPAAARSPALPAVFEGGLDLLGYEAELDGLAPGGELVLRLYWNAREPVAGNYSAFVHLLDEAGEMVAQNDAPPSGIYPTSQWQPGTILGDTRRLALPADLPPGRYRLQAGLYDPATGERAALATGGDAVVLGYPWVGSRPAPVPAVSSGALFGGAIRLLGYDLTPAPSDPLSPGQPLTLVLYWQVLGTVDKDYTIFVHLLDPAGQIRGQGDGPPMGGAYPTSYWQPGDIVVDGHTIVPAADAPAGQYSLLVGLYTPTDGTRLRMSEGTAPEADALPLPGPEIR